LDIDSSLNVFFERFGHWVENDGEWEEVEKHTPVESVEDNVKTIE